MRRNFFFLLLTTLLLTSCIKDLKKEGIYTTTICRGVLVEQRTNQPVSGMRVSLTNGDKIPMTVVSSVDGTFEIEVSAEEVSQRYYLQLEADSLYDSKQVSLQEVGYGKKTFDIGTIYIVGPEVPVVNTLDIGNITAVTARCSGTVVDGGKSNVIARGFCWSTAQYPSLSDSHIVSGSGLGNFQEEITGLAVGTTYYVRAYATNGVGTGYGDQLSFTTLAGLPVVNTESISSIMPTSAVCGGNVTEDGGFAVTARGVCWSTTLQPTISNEHSSNGTGLGSYISNLSGLQPNTTYYVRAYATKVNGTVYGEQHSFTTTSGLPIVNTAIVTNIANGSATCGGTVQSDGGFTVTARGICYSTSPSPTTASPHTTDGTGLGSFVSQMTGLTSGVTYYVRAYATNGLGTVYGEERVFEEN